MTGVLGLIPNLFAATTCPYTGVNTPPCAAQLTPNLSGGDPVLADIANTLGFLTLVVAMIVIFIAAIMWQVSSRSNNPQRAYDSRKAMVAAFATALFLGMTGTLITFYANLGEKLFR